MKKISTLVLTIIIAVITFSVPVMAEGAAQTRDVSLTIGKTKLLSFKYEGQELELSKDNSNVEETFKKEGFQYSLEIKGMNVGNTVISLSDSGETKMVINVTIDPVYLEGYDSFKWLASQDFEQFKQGKGDHNCAPTAVANVLSFCNSNGIDMYSGEFTQSMYNELCGMLKFNPDTGTNWKNQAKAITNFASKYGKEAKVTDLEVTWENVTENIDSGIPLIMATKGHAVMLIGYYENSDGTRKVVSLYGYNNPYTKDYTFDAEKLSIQSVSIS